ncbi:hypothetical protein GGI07_001262 [Coemansia sp. Benny D115]|nr:hypothetical protein GGI07_001262 [Coemansia sp. Benny D115]
MVFRTTIYTLAILAATSTAPYSATGAPADGASSAVSTTFNTEISKYNFDDSSYSYCNPGYPLSDTYTSVADAQLEFVQLSVRHGDRTPVHLIPNDSTTWNCDGIEEDIYLHGAGEPNRNNSGSFQQVIEIPSWNKKHGFANQIWKGTCESGQLTDHGKLQHRTLGENLRRIYVDKLAFLPEKLNRTSEVYLRTTNIWRTKNSAESLLGALWPNRGFSPSVAIPMHTLPARIENMYGNTDACPAINSVMSLITKSEQYQKFMEEQGPLMARLAGIFGIDGNSWRDTWDGYFDVLNARQCHGFDLPCSHVDDSAKDSTSKCATADDVLQVQRNSHYETTLKFRDHLHAQNATKLYIGSFIGDLKDQLEDRIAGKTGDLKLAVYSGHDSTVMPMLAALKASNHDMLWPPYASNLVFELWRKNDGNRVVRVLYNGRVLRLQEGFEWCDLNACPVKTFFEHLDKYIPRDIVAECAA